MKVGLEIHQQLDTTHKLFCNCPTELTEQPNIEFNRMLRPTQSELGQVDQAALFEFKKGKTIEYDASTDTSCLVEMDEEPPHNLNEEAIDIALTASILMNSKPVDEIHVMRKIVIDGSNTSGFQRTMLIGMSGFLEVNNKRIGIDVVCLEEEACQIIDRTKEYDVYNLSRLGIPLIEIATAADIKTPEEAKEVAAKIGMILRSVPGMKRGIGTIRQDVNMSIKGGARVEPKVIDYEIDRQLKLINQGKKPEEEVRKAEDDLTTSYLRPMPGMDRMYPETDIPPIIPEVEGIEAVKTIDEKISEAMHDYKISKELASEIVNNNIDFLKLVREFAKLQPRFIADILINAPKEIKTRFKKDINVFEHLEVLAKANKNEIPESAVFEILTEIAHGNKPRYEKYRELSDDELEKEIADLMHKNKDAPINALMGLLMAKHRGKVDGKKAMELLKKHKK